MMGLSLPTGTGGRNLKLDFVYIENVVNGFMAALAKLKNQETAEAEYALRSGSAHTLREVVDTFDPVLGTSFHVEWGISLPPKGDFFHTAVSPPRMRSGVIS